MRRQNNEENIADHYCQTNLSENIAAAFEQSGRDIRDYNDTESLDEFHIRGREATRELAGLANLKPGMRVLDLGSGIGGPARVLAAEFGCVVAGIDLVAEYCRVAEMITRRAGLSHQVSFQQGDMTALPYDEGIFDAVFTLHTMMNIADKETLADNILRVLKPGGCFALYEVCQGTLSSPYFPVPWAGGPKLSFLLRPEALHDKLVAHGFQSLFWRDGTEDALCWFQAIAEKRAASHENAERTGKKEKPRPGISLLLGPDAAEKSRNVFRNLSENRIRTVFGVFQKSG